jgi:hypothetical protein
MAHAAADVDILVQTTIYLTADFQAPAYELRPGRLRSRSCDQEDPCCLRRNRATIQQVSGLAVSKDRPGAYHPSITEA